MKKINVQTTLDNAKLTALHWHVLIWCSLVIIVDAYDLIVYGAVAGTIAREWKLNSDIIGYLGSSALVGMMLGAIVFGSLADVFGRKNMLMLCIAIFSIFTFWTGFTTDVWGFGATRFIAGLGIGGAMPNAVSLMNEYAPKRLRSLMVSIMFSGYGVGGLLAALIGREFIPAYGWQIMFYIAGIPILLVFAIWILVPDSLVFLIKQNKTDEAKRAFEKLTNTNLDEDNELEINKNQKVTESVVGLFKENRTFTTFLFWIAFFMNLWMVYALSTFLPKLMANAGYGFEDRITFLLYLNVGGIIGAILGGWLSDKFHHKPVLMIFFILSGIALALLGFKNSTWILNILVALGGVALIGGQILLYGYVARYYPISVRGSALGWASGVGRAGGILGPILLGKILILNWAHETYFYIFLIPSFIVVICMFLTQTKYATREGQDTISNEKENE